MTGIDDGMGALDKATKLPFPEFTAKLVTSTFDALIGANVHQMEAYANLVKDLAKTLQTFQTENVTEAEITKFLTDNYPDGSGGTSVSKDFDFKTIPASGDEPEKKAYDIYKEIFESLVDEKLKNIWYTGTTVPAGEASKPTVSAEPESSGAAGKYFNNNQVSAIRTAVGRFLATNMLDLLRTMAREGMARIVIDNGTILSKLTFHVSSTDIDVKSKSQYQTGQLGASIKGRAGLGWWGVKSNASYGSLNVKTVNETTYSKVTMDAEMIGQVEIHFHTQTFPPIVTTPTP